MLVVQGHQELLVLLPADPGKAGPVLMWAVALFALFGENSIIFFNLSGFLNFDKKETYSKTTCSP